MNAGRVRLHITVCALSLAVVEFFFTSAPVHADTVIDDFSTNQSALTLTYPPAGTSASSSASGAGIIGGERDLQINLTAGVIAGNTMSATVSSGFFSYSQDATIAGNGTLQWDGTDGSPTLNATGLGGIDLSAGGSQDAIRMNLFFDDLPTNVTLTLYTDAGNASATSFTTPGLLFSATNFDIPLSSFTTTLGNGADVSNIGAITMSLGSTTTAPDVVIDFMSAVSLITASQTVAFLNDANGDGVANAGDTLRYTLVITNPTDAIGAAEQNVMALAALDPNTTIIVGSVTTTQGTVTEGNTAGDTTANVSIGTVSDGANVTITYDVTVNTPLPGNVAQISSQATISSASLTNLLSDDPGQPGSTDPTIVNASSMPVRLQSFEVD
jgi:hypothetical protein